MFHFKNANINFNILCVYVCVTQINTKENKNVLHFHMHKHIIESHNINHKTRSTPENSSLLKKKGEREGEANIQLVSNCLIHTKSYKRKGNKTPCYFWPLK